MPNSASSGTGFLTVSALIKLFGEKKAWEFMDKLNENIAVYTHSGSKPAKMAGAGEYPIGISFGYRGIIQKKKGEPVETIFPKEGRDRARPGSRALLAAFQGKKYDNGRRSGKTWGVRP